jgi:WD40 repeat protein
MAPSPAANKTVTAAPAATPKKVTHPEDEELRRAMQEIEKGIRERNDPQFPMMTLTVHRQTEDTAPVTICLPQDRARVDPAEDICIVWLYPNDKGLGYAAAEQLLRNHLKPLGYKLTEPRNKYSDGKSSYHHWIVKKVKLEPEPPTVEAQVVLEGHTSFVNCVCFSPDGKTVASGAGLYGDSDNTVRLWDADTGKQLIALKGSTDRVVGIAYTPDGKLLASVGSSICLWDIASGKPQWTFEMQGMRPVRGNCVCFSPDGKAMACGCSDATVRMWDPGNQSLIREMQGHRRGLESVMFSPNGRFLASGSADGTVRLWETDTGAEMHTLQGNSACYSPDGAAVATASPDRIVRIWDTASGKQRQALEGHDGEVTSVCYSPDGKTLASGSKDTTIHVWDLATGKQLYVLKGHTNDVRALSFSPNGLILASASSDKTVRLWTVGNRDGERRAVQPQNAEPAKAPVTGQLKSILDHIARGDAASISEFALTQEANAQAQAKVDTSWAADNANAVKTVLLKAIAGPPARAFLLINIGTSQALCSKYEAFNKRGLFERLVQSLPTKEAEAIQPVSCHENFSLPGMNLMPGDHLKPFVDAILRNEYEILEVAAPEKTKIAVSTWKEEQNGMRKNLSDAEGMFSAALAAAEAEARKDRSVSLRKIFLSQQMGQPVIAWSTPDDGTAFNSERARELLTKHMSPLGYDVTGSFVGGDPQDNRSYCYFYMYKKSGEQ